MNGEFSAMIRRQASIFLIVGVTSVLIDLATYRALMAWSEGVTADVAKTISFFTGTFFSYYANRLWTFQGIQSKPGSHWRFMIVYSFTLIANVGMNSIALSLLKDIPFSTHLAFLIATAVSCTVSFTGMKYFAFRGVHS